MNIQTVHRLLPGRGWGPEVSVAPSDEHCLLIWSPQRQRQQSYEHHLGHTMLQARPETLHQPLPEGHYPDVALYVTMSLAIQLIQDGPDAIIVAGNSVHQPLMKVVPR